MLLYKHNQNTKKLWPDYIYIYIEVHWYPCQHQLGQWCERKCAKGGYFTISGFHVQTSESLKTNFIPMISITSAAEKRREESPLVVLCRLWNVWLLTRTLHWHCTARLISLDRGGRHLKTWQLINDKTKYLKRTHFGPWCSDEESK